ncbi:MAG: beta-ketoacyl synthase chain length factor, partial [Acetobacteraceae bacterium]|nr:beta-ketoacyl synthase chain length factor [Acetobacteraceae bacterium]
AGEERVVSPTQFHNSVHNAAAGYWSIATGSRQPLTCIGCHDDTWPASLLAAMAEVACTGEPVLLCCYDHPLPAPLQAVRPTGPLFGLALVLGQEGRGASLAVEHRPGSARAPMLDPPLDTIAPGNPAAASLPLLAAVARARPRGHDLPYLDAHLRLEFEP